MLVSSHHLSCQPRQAESSLRNLPPLRAPPVPWKQATPRQIRSVARSGCLAKKTGSHKSMNLWGKGWVLCFDGIVGKSMTHVFGRSMFEKYSDSKPKVKEISNFRPLNWLLKQENSWNYLWWGSGYLKSTLLPKWGSLMFSHHRNRNIGFFSSHTFGV